MDDNWLKGKLAETVVEYMFLASGVEIFSSGAENYSDLVRQMIKGKGNGIYDKSARPLFNIPDFTIVNGKKLEFIEVKYRQQGRFNEEDFENFDFLRNYWRPIVILVSNNRGNKYGKPIFQIVFPEYRLDSERNPIDCKLPIEKEDWHIDHGVYEECKKMIIASPVFADKYGYKAGDKLL